MDKWQEANDPAQATMRVTNFATTKNFVTCLIEMLHNLKKLVFDSWIYKKELTKEVFRQEIERLEKFTRGVCVIKKFFKDS